MNDSKTLQEILTEIQTLRENVQHLEKRFSSSKEPPEELPSPLIELSSKIFRVQDPEEFFQSAANILQDITKASRIAIYHFNADNTGEFIAEAKENQWSSIFHLQQDHPEIKTNISQCTLKYLRLPEYQSSPAESVAPSNRAHLFRVCNDVTTAGFSHCYLQVLNLYQAKAYAITPLYDGQQCWGLLAAYHNTGPHIWQQWELNYLSQVGVYLEFVLNQAQLQAKHNEQEKNIRAQLTQQIHVQQQAIRQEQRQEQALNEVIDTIRRSLNLEETFAAAVKETRRFLQADHAAIYQFTPDSNCEIGSFVAEDKRPEFSSALNTQVKDRCFSEDYQSQYRFGHISQIHDVDNAPIADCHRQILQQFQIRSNLVAPILCQDKLWGLFCIHQCSQPRTWSKKEGQFIQKISVQLGVALQQVKLYEQAQKRTKELQIAIEQVEAQKETQTRLATQERAISSIIERMRNTLDLETTFRSTTQELLNLFQCDRVTVFQFDKQWNGTFIAEAYAEGCKPLIVNNVGMTWKDEYLRETQGGKYANHEISAVSDIYAMNYGHCHIEMLESLQIRAYLIVPIFVGQKLWGLLSAYENQNIRHWQAWETDLLKRLGDQLGVALYQHQLIEQLRQASEQAKSANSAKNLFLANMSHELRTPLNAILGFTQVLRRQEDLTELQQNHLDIIGRAGKHLLVLLNDVLTMSKIEANQIHLKTEYFELNQMVKTVQDIFRLQAQQQKLSFVVEIAPDSPNYLYGDQGKLQQVVINLLSNAFKFTGEGEVCLKFWVEKSQADLESDGQVVALHCQVQDTGVGIAVEEQEELFAPFVQTRIGKQTKEGTGLGLAISKRFIELMGGNIWVESKVGQGSCFEFFVELKMHSLAMAIAPTENLETMLPGQRVYKLLVVDNQEDSRLALCSILKSFGFEVMEANSGQEAIARLKECQPDLIWLDLDMPHIDGDKTIRSIRQDLKDHTVKIIALTAHITDEKRQNLNDLGCDYFIIKPFVENEILAILSQQLNIKFGERDSSSESGLSSKLIPSPNQKSFDYPNRSIYNQLQQTSPAWREQLRQAAIAARETQLSALIRDISNDWPELGQYLQQQQFELAFHTIIQLVDEVESL